MLDDAPDTTGTPTDLRGRITDLVARHWARIGAVHPKLRRRPAPEVVFYRRGSALGRAYLAGSKPPWVAFHEGLLARPDGEAQIEETVVHELAHVAAWLVAGDRGHGAAWKETMHALGFEPRRTHAMDVSDQPGVQRRWRYVCACTRHELSTTRHNRVERGSQSYRCRRCGEVLRYADA